MFTVQRGSLGLSSNTSGTISISAVDTSNSFIIARTRATSSTNANNVSVSVRFTTTGSSVSSLSWVRGSNATDVTLEWQVITSPDISVQHFYSTLTNGNTILNTTISTVDQSKTFILGTVDTAVNNASPQRYIPIFDVTSTTNARVSRFVTNDDINVAFHVVEFTDSTTVQKVSGNIPNAQSTLSPTITAVDLSRSFIVGHYSPTNAQNANAAMFSFGSTTQVDVVRTGTSGTMPVLGFVVQLPSGSSVQSHSISAVSNPTAQAITAVSATTNAFTIATNTVTGTGSNLDRRFITTNLTTSTNVNVHLGDTTDNVDAVLFVVDSPSGGAEETAEPSPHVLEYSIPSPTVTVEREAAVQAVPVALVCSISSPTVITEYEAVVNASPVQLTYMIPSPGVLAEREALAVASPVQLTFTIPSPTVVIEVETVAESTAYTLEYSIPTSTVSAEREVMVEVQPAVLTYAIPSPAVAHIYETVATPGPVTLTFTASIPTVIVEQGEAVNVGPYVLEYTISSPTVSIEVEVVVTPSAFVLEYTIPATTAVAERDVVVAVSPVQLTYTAPYPTVIAEWDVVASPTAYALAYTVPSPEVTAESDEGGAVKDIIGMGIVPFSR